MEQERLTGVLKMWHTEKRFGFIKLDRRDPDLFCHWSDWDGDPAPAVGMRVSFLRVESDRGPRAVEIVPLVDAGGR